MNNMRTFAVLTTLLVAFVLAPVVVEAHGGEGMTLSATTTEGSIIDIDYTGLIVEAGVSGSFIFNLFTDDTRTVGAPFKDLWVRVIQEDGTDWGRTIFAGPIARPEFGGQGFLYIFPEGGDYRLSIRYNREDELEAGRDAITAEFPLTVYRSSQEEKFEASQDFFVGIGVGALGLLILLLPIITRRKLPAA